MSEEFKKWTEEIKVSGEELLRETEKLFREGNVSHLVVKNDQGVTVAEFPVTMGIIGVLLAPTLAAIAAIAVYASHFTIVVTRTTTVEVDVVEPVESAEPPKAE